MDKEYAACPAQYAFENGKAERTWDKNTKVLADLDTHKLHYVMQPSNHIFIDFDIPDESGGKSFERNREAAEKWPPTYAETSKSGAGIHLHYIYEGDVSELAKLYAPHVEIKVLNGKTPIRRKLTKCNNLPIATLTSGLPFICTNLICNKNKEGI